MNETQKLKLKKRIESRIVSKDNCWITNYAIDLSGNSKRQQIACDGKTKLLKRVAYEIYNGEDPKDLCVYSRCDNILCINPQHLFLGTKTENGPNQRRCNRQKKGNKTGVSKSKLTKGQVMEIKKLLLEKQLTLSEIAKLFCVSCSTIHSINKDLTWTHVIYDKK